MNGLFRLPILILMVIITSFTTFAFASSQTDRSGGGEGANQVSGYDISGVHYQLTEDASKLASVEFDLNGSASMVKASVRSSGVFFDCRNTGGYHWLCAADASVSVSEMNELKVIATGG